MKVLFTDHDLLDISLERDLFREAGITLIEAQCRSQREVVEASEGCSALLIQYAPVSDEVFAARPGIGLCSRIGAGYDTIDTAAAQRHGVWVANSPDYGVGEVSTHALAMMLSLLRNIARYDQDIRQGQWHYSTAGRIPRATNLTVGVMGLGRIGKRFAHIARNTFGQVIAYDPHIIDGDFPAYVRRVRSLDELFSQADAVSIHCLLNDETRGLVGASLLQRMKPGSYLVNTARGAIVDIPGLLEVLAQDRLAGVGLDVLPDEPITRDHRLLADRRVLLSPHAAFYSAESEVELRRKAALNIVTWMRTGRPDYPVVVGTRHPPA
ncbi:MAG: C-terminal binding protein [Burkholderiaceae bacterium]|nr:C-terminal binding protein [Burkholderiaceae bacterium]MBP6813585.1 C-terminal binding protein [Burkholderiaceae bacterium]